MPNYRRLYVSGGTYFFTVTLADRRSRLLVEHAPALRDAWRFTFRRMPFRTIAYVVLPDHLHCMWRLPDGDTDFSTRWKVLKARFSRAIHRTEDAAIRLRGGERGVWQRRFWEHLVRDQRDFDAHIRYIHDNPVRHGHALHRDDWPWSSWPRYKALQTWPEDREEADPRDFGE